MYTKRIVKEKKKLIKTLEKQKVLTEKAFKTNQDLVANEILNIV